MPKNWSRIEPGAVPERDAFSALRRHLQGSKGKLAPHTEAAMGEGGFSLVNLGELSKPITKLVESISDGIGAWWKPHGIRREAKAEAEAATIKAKAEIEIQQLEERAAERVSLDQTRQQANIERIIDGAVRELPESVSEEPVDPDWTSAFFADCKDISNEEMQSLWSRILAGEVASPGSFSRRTLAIVKSLSKIEAHNFTQLCGTAYVNEPHSMGVIYTRQTLNALPLNYSQLIELESIGLISHNPLTGFDAIHGTPINLLYFGKQLILTVPKSAGRVRLSGFPFTRIGIELSRISGASSNTSYMDNLIADWKLQSIIVEWPEGRPDL